MTAEARIARPDPHDIVLEGTAWRRRAFRGSRSPKIIRAGYPADGGENSRAKVQNVRGDSSAEDKTKPACLRSTDS